MFVEDADAAEQWLGPRLRPGDVVLVKSSNASGLRLLGDRLPSAHRCLGLLGTLPHCLANPFHRKTSDAAFVSLRRSCYINEYSFQV